MDYTDSLSTLYSLDARLDALQRLLEKRLPDSELVTDYDVSTVLTIPTGSGAFAVFPITLPRTLRHVELTLSGIFPAASGGVGAVLMVGNLSSALAAQQLSTAGAADSAACASAGGQVKARMYLDGSGYLTVVAPVTTTAANFVTVRVRSLDVVSRSKNTADVANVEVGWE